jgi:PhoH-like ATPase
VDAFKGQEIFGHVTLEKSERSPLAELAAELL